MGLVCSKNVKNINNLPKFWNVYSSKRIGIIKVFKKKDLFEGRRKIEERAKLYWCD